MRITTLLLALLIAAYFVQGFNAPKCKHVFTQVEQAKITIEQPGFTLNVGLYEPYSWSTGLQEGKELICVKCFHKQKQVLDYGEPAKNTLTDLLHSGTFCDSINISTSGLKGLIDTTGNIIKWDTLYGY